MYSKEAFVKEVKQAVDNNTFFCHHNNLVLVGNNSTGKSSFIKDLLKCVVKTKSSKFYYIDSKNRNITDNSENLMTKRYSEYNVLGLIKARTDLSNFNQHDVFENQDSGSLVSISEIISGIDYYSELFEEMLGMTLSLCDEPSDEGETEADALLKTGMRKRVLVNGRHLLESVSSSEASKMRLLLEIRNAQVKECKVVVIDEFDIHLDNDETVEFMEKIIEKFPSLRFIFAIHNLERIVNMKDMDVYVFNIDGEKGINKLLDSNDIQEIGQIHRLKSKYIGKKGTAEPILEECVEMTVKQGKLDERLILEFDKIDADKLAGRTLVWYNFVKRKIQNET